MYRGHKITQGDTDGFAAIFGGQWCHISGPAMNGGTPNGLADAKRMVRDGIRHRACFEATQHLPTFERNGNLYCSHCKDFRGHPAKPGQGAKITYYRDAANGHRYGWTVKRDRLGKWYAVDFNPKARDRENRQRIVKCATRAKAKAKATEWWLAAREAKSA